MQKHFITICGTIIIKVPDPHCGIQTASEVVVFHRCMHTYSVFVHAESVNYMWPHIRYIFFAFKKKFKIPTMNNVKHVLPILNLK